MAAIFDRARARFRPTGEDHRVTPLELLFDLVFVYAITNVTALVEHDLTRVGVLDGLVTLAVVWFGWCSYTWLGNQTRADEGLARLAVILAMAAMFFVAISIPHAFEDGGNAATVLTVAYAVVRFTHLFTYLLAAGDDGALRSVVLAMMGVAGSTIALMAVGAGVDAETRKWWWLAAVVVDQVGVYALGSTRWQLPSAAHFAERFGLIIIIAIGESVVAVGASTSDADLGGRDAAALTAGLAVAVCLWWLYFDVVALVAERVLRQADGVERVRLARDSYTYVHFPMVAGIVFIAVGLVVLIHDDGHLAQGRGALYGGVVAYLAGQALFRLRNVGGINPGRAVLAVALLVGIPALDPASALVQLVACAGSLVALVAWEVWAYRDARAEIRHSSAAGPGHSGPGGPA
jgi:low temperature requirement protein LtrA